MISRTRAIEIARAMLGDLAKKYGIDVVLLEQQTREFDFGWMFFYNSRSFVETGDPDEKLAGNAPIIIDRDSATGSFGNSAYSVERNAEEYRCERTVKR